MVYWQDALLRKVGSTPTVAFSLSLKNMKKQNLEIKYLPVADLIPYVRNSRTHTPEQVAQIASSIKEFGFTNPVLIDSEKGIIAGHGRVMGAQKLGLKEVPTIEVTGWTDAQKRAYIIADNKLALNAGWDEEILRLEFEELKDGAFDLELTGFDTAEIDEILDVDISLDDVEEDEAPEPPVVPKSQLGDVWILGRHRLVNGDSTKIEDVDKLMCGEKADLLFTDPPYGVSYEKKTKEVLKSKNYTKISNDDLTLSEFQSFLFDVFSNARVSLKDTASYYVFSCQGGDQEMMMMMMRECDIPCRHQIIWVKDAPVFSMGRLDYDYKHEPILYGWVKKHDFQRKGEQDKSVWEFKRTENKLHPTMKPVDLIVNALMNSTKKNEVVLDFFGGSGSTLIACEQTDRKARLMELDPRYCDVIINRWQTLTGLEAVRDDGIKFNEL